MANKVIHEDVLSWLDKHPTSTFVQFKRENPKTKSYEKYFNNTKYSRNKKLKKSELDRRIAEERKLKQPEKIQKHKEPVAINFDLGSELNALIENVSGTMSKKSELFASLVDSAANTVIALSCNPKIDAALEIANETLDIAGNAAISYNILVKSMSKIVADSEKMTKGEIVDAICLSVGLRPKKSAADTAKRLQEVSARLLQVMNKK